jgi:hypothetical protein
MSTPVTRKRLSSIRYFSKAAPGEDVLSTRRMQEKGSLIDVFNMQYNVNTPIQQLISNDLNFDPYQLNKKQHVVKLENKRKFLVKRFNKDTTVRKREISV